MNDRLILPTILLLVLSLNNAAVNAQVSNKKSSIDPVAKRMKMLQTPPKQKGIDLYANGVRQSCYPMQMLQPGGKTIIVEYRCWVK